MSCEIKGEYTNRIFNRWLEEQEVDYSQMLVKHTIACMKKDKDSSFTRYGFSMGDRLYSEGITQKEEEIAKNFAFLNYHLNFDVAGEA